MLAVGFLLASALQIQAADITGKITLKGTPPAEKELPLDPSCGQLHAGKAKPTTHLYNVDKSGNLADVFVYIKSGLTSKPAPSSQPVVLDQVGCEYTPYVFGLQIGKKLAVKTSDPMMHNVHVMPEPKYGNKESNRAQMPNTPNMEYVFDKPEVFLRFKCDVHIWMFAYAGLVDHPYFAVSGPDGTFKIANVPPGKYVIEAVHRKAHTTADGAKGITQEIMVGADGAKADFTVEVPPAQ